MFSTCMFCDPYEQGKLTLQRRVNPTKNRVPEQQLEHRLTCYLHILFQILENRTRMMRLELFILQSRIPAVSATEATRTRARLIVMRDTSAARNKISRVQFVSDVW